MQFAPILTLLLFSTASSSADASACYDYENWQQDLGMFCGKAHDHVHADVQERVMSCPRISTIQGRTFVLAAGSFMADFYDGMISQCAENCDATYAKLMKSCQISQLPGDTQTFFKSLATACERTRPTPVCLPAR